MVDAALASLERGEFVSIASLPDAQGWQTHKAASQEVLPNLSGGELAAPYFTSKLEG